MIWAINESELFKITEVNFMTHETFLNYVCVCVTLDFSF